MKKLGFALVAILLMISAGLAQKGSLSGDFKKTADLVTTEHGASFGIEGQAMIAQRGGIQYFGVRCVAGVDDGTVLFVKVTTSEGTFKVGTLTIFEKTGQLLLQSSGNTLSPVFPVTDIQTVRLYDLKGMLAEAAF